MDGRDQERALGQYCHVVLLILTNVQEVEFEAWSYTSEVYPLFWRLLDPAVELQDQAKVLISTALSKLKKVSWKTGYGGWD